MEENSVSSRIIYVDPNDSMGNINGIPLTPDYSDLCIAFNLIVEIVPRFKSNAAQGTDVTEEHCLFWRCRAPIDGKQYAEGNYVSFLHGEKGFLTTFYTDTNYEDVVAKNIVEGLGIENITVAFENYYTPTVTIKFVDQRGSSLFGREEATHDDDKLTIDNIFGAFFTAPYPKFKLQFKGFYGQAVTLQLTCSGFKGSLNPQTGNFEATATFIGYSYSLLTDIPFQYIVAAPFCNYAGRDYWDQNANSPSWQFSDGSPMIRLYDFFKTVNDCMTDDSLLKVISEENEEVIKNGETEKGEIGEIISALSKFKNALMNSVSNCFIENYDGTPIEDEQLVLFSDSDKIDISDAINESWKALREKIRTYNENHPAYEIPQSSMPNERSVNSDILEMWFFDTFVLNKDADGKVNFVAYSSESGAVGAVSEETLRNVKFNIAGNEQRKLSDSTIKVLMENIQPHSVSNKIKSHVYIMDFHDLRKRLKERAVYVDDEKKRIEQMAERNYVELAKSKLHVVPYIGNIFKMIMAHIDTFVHIMYTCFDRIEQQRRVGQRTAEFLGVKLSSTDIPNRPNQKDIPAWPLVTKGNPQKSEYVAQEDNTIAWVGDISPGLFEEEKLVRDLFFACKRASGDNFKNAENETNVFYIPVIPSDINLIGNTFQGDTDTNISVLAGMLGIRAAQIFGIVEKSAIDNGIAKVMGRMDAYNYYLQNPSKSEIKTNVLEACGNKSFANKMRDIMLCKKDEDNMGETLQNGNQRHKFERKPVTSEERHPIYKENNSSLNYIHYFTKSHFALVPSVIQSFGTYDNRYVYRMDSNGNPYFDYVKSNNTIPNTLVNCTSVNICHDIKPAIELNDYVNTEMFNVEMNRGRVDGILNRYEEMKTNSFKIMGEQYKDDFSKVLDRYWNVSDNAYKKSLEWIPPLATPKYEDLGANIEYLGEGGVSKAVRDSSIQYKGNGEWGDGKSIDSYFIDSPSITLCVKRNEFKRCSLFGSFFYYMQNFIDDKITRNSAKALLFLHGMIRHFIRRPKISAFSNKSCGGIEIANPSYMLLLGGLLWRKRYIEDNKKDPILYESSGFEYRYEAPDMNHTLYHNTGSEKFFCSIIRGQGLEYNVSIDSLFNNLNVDYHVRNVLIKNFEAFVSKEFQTIMNKLELKAENSQDGMVTPSLLNEVYLLSQNKVDTAMQIDWSGNDNSRKTLASTKFRGFFDSYIYYDITRDRARPLFLYTKDNDTVLQDLLKWLYAGKCIIIDTPSYIQKSGTNDAPRSGTDVSVSSSNLMSYLEGFGEALKSITDSVSETAISNGDTSSEKYGDIAEFDKDVAVPIYMYLKMVWDKWLVASDKLNPYDNEYNVRNFFKNFVFIDSFYRNISNRFMLNCGILLNRYNDNKMGTKDYPIFKFIGDITSDHNCLFLAVPDFIGDMAMNDNGKTKAMEALSSIFKPVPFDKMRDLDLNNKFVIIYIPKLSETPSELNNYSADGFNIWSYNEKDGVCPPVLKATKANSEDITPYGYYVPSFGMAYGRQHNHLFKSVNLNMETPIITSTVINTISHISRMGASNEHAIAYVGQDIYPVFSNYSYICEFEMMGCAQIQPLMYFQLMNVPMWRGTYMIFNVTHTMTPGNMVTRVRAMKLSNRAVPYSNAWFKKNMNYDPSKLKSSADCGEAEPSSGGQTSGGESGGGYDANVYSGKTEHKKYIDLDKVLESRASGKYYSPKTGWMTIKPLNGGGGRGQCTEGPKTWIQAGLKAKSVNSKIPGDLRPTAWIIEKGEYAACALKNWGFRKVKSFNTIAEVNAFKPQVCDILSCFTTVNGHQHMCMWDGEHWVSDFVQNNAWVYPNLGISSWKEKPAIWQFDDNLWYEQHKKYLG